MGYLPPNAGTGFGADGVDVPVESWVLIESHLVTPDKAALAKGGRYTLFFPKGSVAESTLVTVHERDPLVADVEFGPDGTQFNAPVCVTIDYKDTALDPSSENYRGLPLRVYWYNPATRGWEPIPFEADRNLRKVRFTVTHFSRYGLTDAVTESEWQWGRTGRQRDGMTQAGSR